MGKLSPELQLALIVLTGLAAKNAVLIGEFARQNEINANNRFGAARVYLWPILMTSLPFSSVSCPWCLPGPGHRHASDPGRNPLLRAQMSVLNN
ncbi:MAG: hypothetical protein ACR2QU_11155 [Gammaproteobacteria bacterium]